jgi:hypothetical protein
MPPVHRQELENWLLANGTETKLQQKKMFQTNYWTELGLALTSGIGETFFTTWCRGSALENILGDCTSNQLTCIYF